MNTVKKRIYAKIKENQRESIMTNKMKSNNQLKKYSIFLKMLMIWSLIVYQIGFNKKSSKFLVIIYKMKMMKYHIGKNKIYNRVNEIK